jgi:hypothetical protein
MAITVCASIGIQITRLAMDRASFICCHDTTDCAVIGPSAVRKYQHAALCCVSFYCAGGEYSNTALGGSLFDVAAKALEFFCAPHWKGPRPRRNTVLDVTVMGEQQRYRVVAGRIERWARRPTARLTRIGCSS